MSCLPQPCCPAALPTRRGLSSTSLLSWSLSGKRRPRYGARDQTPVPSSVLVLGHSLPRDNEWERERAKQAYSSLHCGWITIAKIPKPTPEQGRRKYAPHCHDTIPTRWMSGCNSAARRSCHFWVCSCICIISLSSLLCSPCISDLAVVLWRWVTSRPGPSPFLSDS
jgi:hypothetical protein